MFSYPHLDLLPEAAAAADSDVGSEIWALLTTLYPHHDALERSARAAIPSPT